MQLGQSIFIM
jgi:hypothetical protein